MCNPENIINLESDSIWAHLSPIYLLTLFSKKTTHGQSQTKRKRLHNSRTKPKEFHNSTPIVIRSVLAQFNQIQSIQPIDKQERARIQFRQKRHMLLDSISLQLVQITHGQE